MSGLASALDGLSPWAVHAGLAASVLFALLVMMQGLLRRRRRTRAWPDHLEFLLEGIPEWRPLRWAGLLLGLGVLGAGCVHVGRWPTVLSGLTVSVCLLVLVHRRWSARMADLGLTLMTLAVCAAFASLGEWFSGVAGWETPVRWGCVLGGTAVMTFMWHWLSGFWRQQLHEGRAWTTAGRMIVPARRMGFVVSGVALVLAARVAVWPKWPPMSVSGASFTGEWMGGLAIALLVLALINRARAARSRVLGMLSAVAVVEGGTFCWLRL